MVSAQQPKINVLIVEDNPGDQVLIRELLMDAEFSLFTVQAATTLSEAIVAVSQGAFDVVLLDLTLPDSSGFQTFINFRSNASSLPIIILTGLEDREIALEALDQGAQDFLSKQRIDTYTLERAIGYAISRKQLEDQNRLQAAALQSTANAVFITDAEGNIEWVNEAFTEMTGYTAEEVINQHPAIFSADDVSTDVLIKSLKDILVEQKVWTHELRNRCKDGRTIIVEQSISPFSSTSHKVTNFVAIQKDITQRKKEQEEIERYSLMLEKVNSFSRGISESLDDDAVYEQLRKQIFELVPDINQITISRFDHQQAFMEDEVFQNPDPPSKEQYPDTINSEFAVPMIAQDSIVGMITLSSFVPDAFNDANAEILGILANTAAVAAGNAQLFKQTQRQISRLSSLRAIDIAITSGSDLLTNLQVLTKQVVSQLQADAVNVLLMNTQKQLLETFVCTGFQTDLFMNQFLHMGEGFAGKAAVNNEIVMIPDLSLSIEQPIPQKLLEAEDFHAYFCVPLVANSKLQGVLEVFMRTPFNPDQDWTDYLEVLGGQAAIAIENAQLFTDLEKSNMELIDAYDITIEGWSRAVELRDVELKGHTRRVAKMTMELAERMGLPEDQKVHIRRGAILHDIGKIGVPDHILMKPGKLTDEEWVIMKSHPVLAYEMLMEIEYLQPAIQIPYAHHEKWDGSGYPRGLKGEEIPIEARIFAVVDVYDALTSDRPYRDAWPVEKVIDYITEKSGSHFDPVVVNIFLKFMEDHAAYQKIDPKTGELNRKSSSGSDKHVVVVDDSMLIRERLKETINSVKGLSVVAEAADTDEALRLIKFINASIYILDIRMPGGGGLAILELLKSLPTPPVVIVFTSFANERYRRSFTQAGADFFFDKSTDMDTLIEVLHNLSMRNKVH